MLGFLMLVIISNIRGENMKYWILAFCLLVSCTTANIKTSYSDDLEKFIGYPENELYDIWGMPDRMFYVTSDVKVVTYLSMSFLRILVAETPYLVKSLPALLIISEVLNAILCILIAKISKLPLLLSTLTFVTSGLI